MNKQIVVKVSDLCEDDVVLINNEMFYVIEKRFAERQVLFQSFDGRKVEIGSFHNSIIKLVSRVRGFEPVVKEKAKYVDKIYNESEYAFIPARKTSKSAGYDFKSPINVVLQPHHVTILFTNVKAYMMDDEELLVSIRSGLSTKGIIMMNAPGKIDSDYYNNSDNDGNIGIILYNTTNEDYVINRGDRIAQGTFSKYLITDNDNATGLREGGIGSTGR